MVDQFDDENETTKPQSSEFAKLLDESFGKSQKKLGLGDKIRGEVLVIGKDEVFVSTGTMHDGLVQKKELLDKEGKLTCKVGDQLDLYVTHARGSEIFLSTNPTAKNIAEDLEDAFDMMLPIEGRVSEICKGGFRVVIRGKNAFCPISQMDLKHIETGEEYVGKKYEFVITQFSEGGRNIVVSRRKLLEEQKVLSAGTFLEEHKVGDVVPGTVTRIEKFGAFIEVAMGVDGLAHISELSWSRVSDPHEVLAIGQQVTVKIIKTDEVDGRLKLSLSIKQAGAEPWQNVSEQIQEGKTVEGKVTRCMKFGAFVEIAPGIEGLVPLSEMSYTKRVVKSDELMKEGERVTVMIKEIHPTEHKILLSLKDAGTDPWSLVPHKFPVGTIVKGKVTRREAYGLFVQLDEGVVALLPKSKAMEEAQFPFDKIKVGEETVVQIGELRLNERRISLCVPQDPDRDEWKNFTPQASGSFGTLGDKMRLAMEKKKK